MQVTATKKEVFGLMLCTGIAILVIFGIVPAFNYFFPSPLLQFDLLLMILGNAIGGMCFGGGLCGLIMTKK